MPPTDTVTTISTIITALTGYGMPGLIISGLVWWHVMKDKELTAERAARVADAKAYADLALGIQAKTFDALDKMRVVTETVQKQQGK